MTPTTQQLIDAIEHVSFEMNRYLYTAHPHTSVSRNDRQIFGESCLLHSRTLGEFFFGKGIKDDILVSHYYCELISKDELENEIEKSKSKWPDYKIRTDKKLCHLTFERLNDKSPMNMKEKDEINFDTLIKLFEKNLPIHFREKWDLGKSYSM